MTLAIALMYSAILVATVVSLILKSYWSIAIE